MPPPNSYRGCGRGVLGLKSFDRPKRPDDLEQRFADLALRMGVGRGRGSQQGSKSATQVTAAPPNSTRQEPTENSSQKSSYVEPKKSASNANGPAVNEELLAKYNYKVNPNSPLDGPELAVTLGEKMKFVSAYDEHWWKVRNEDGAEGYVPAKYMMVMEKKVGLPWLQNRTPEPIPEPEVKTNVFGAPQDYKAPVKPYKPSYQHEGLPNTDKSNSPQDYFCDVCQKQLNGPMPYKAHLASKVHREEVELAKEYAS